MRICKLIILGFFWSLLALPVAKSQTTEVERSEIKTFIDGREYYIHKVTRIQSLSGICDAYNISEKELVVENPQLTGGLKVGLSLKIPVIKGKNSNESDLSRTDKFYYHTLERQQTLFYLSRLYNVSQDDIIKFNPEVRLGLKKGQVLRIPRNDENFDPGAEYFLYHKVERGQTLFYLAQFYGVTIATITNANPNLANEGLKRGQVIIIPKKGAPKNKKLIIEHDTMPDNEILDDTLFYVAEEKIKCDSFYYDPNQHTFKIALMLPLEIDENTKKEITDETRQRDFKFHQQSRRFFEFYEGFLLAVELMKNKGINTELFVYDTKRSATTVQEILWRSELKEMDLIVGPVYSRNVQLVAEFAARHQINMVSPLSRNDDLLINNPYLFQVNPSENTRFEKTSQYLSNFYDSSIVVIHSGLEDEQLRISQYRENLIKAFRIDNVLDEIVYKEINFKIRGATAIEDALSVGLDNIVIIPSEDEVLVMDIITKLGHFSDNYNITVYGMPRWEIFETIELDLMTKLNVHIPSSTYIDYADWSINNFIRKYRAIFYQEPSVYSYLAYDVGNFFLQMLKSHGPEFQFCTNETDILQFSKGLQTEFSFRKAGKLGGFENQGIFMLKYTSDYNLNCESSTLKNNFILNRFLDWDN